MGNTWFIIANPSSGNKVFSVKWKVITKFLDYYGIKYQYTFTKRAYREVSIVKDAIEQGYRNFISVGGDGTLHQIVNGIMQQTEVKPSDITVAVIPLGTGNDWIKTYKIPQNIRKAIKLLVAKKTILQDIGCLHMQHKTVYFNNGAGIGYDAYVVKNLVNFKFLGRLSYLVTATISFLKYKLDKYKIVSEERSLYTDTLMVAFNICKYSGGGMQLTNNSKLNNGKLNISILKDINFVDLLLNTFNLYNNKIIYFRKVETFQTKAITVNPDNRQDYYIQADGELIGKGDANVSIIEKAINFVIP